MISASSQTLDVKHHTQKIADFTHISYTISTTYKTPYFYMVNVREKNSNAHVGIGVFLLLIKSVRLFFLLI